MLRPAGGEAVARGRHREGGVANRFCVGHSPAAGFREISEGAADPGNARGVGVLAGRSDGGARSLPPP